MATELKPGQKRFTAGAVFADIAIVAWFIFALFPILWMLLLALKNEFTNFLEKIFHELVVHIAYNVISKPASLLLP